MPVLRFAEMTFADVERARERLVPILPVGALEAHGPHLPLGTDVIIAEAMAEAGAARMAARGLEPAILPPIVYSPAGYAAAFPGTISVRAEIAAGLIQDLAAGLATHGLRWLVVANAHLDPGHIDALRSGLGTGVGGLRVVFPDVTRKPWALRLGDEFRSGACHAGRYEGSIVRAVRPDLFRESIARTLAPNPSSLSVAIRTGKTTFHDAGGPQAYFGDPAAASAEEGRALVETLGAILDEASAEAGLE